MNTAKILFWDIETTPIEGSAWGTYKTNLIEIHKYKEILSVAWKWNESNKTYFKGVWDFENEQELVEHISNLMDRADIVVAHNGNRFDIRVLNARIVKYGLKPYSPVQLIDTMKVARSIGDFNGNSLRNLAKYLGLSPKGDMGGIEAIRACMNGDRKAQRQMEKYNRQDVVTLEEVYLRLLPWIKNHPSLSVIGDMPEVCPKCGGDSLRQGGFMATKTGKRKRYQCLDCGGWVSGRLIGGVKPEYIN